MTRKRPREERIGDIIQAAVDEFLERGYDDASMEAIARRAGISKGGLYHHFTSKDEILLMANKKLNEPVAQLMQEALQEPNACEGLCRFIENYLNYWLNHQREMIFYMLSYVKLLDNPNLSEMYESYAKSTIGFYQGLFQRGIDSGEFIPHAAYESALALMAAVDGIVMYVMMDKELDTKKIIKVFQERFVRRLQAEGKSLSKIRRKDDAIGK
jgi:AcrR family transcriptional regulator